MTQIKNIGIVTTWFERGAAYVSRQYMNALVSSGCNVFIYARGGESFAVNDRVWDMPNVTWGRCIDKLGHPKTAIDNEHLLHWAQKNKIETVIFNEQLWWSNVIELVRAGIKTGAYIDYYNETILPYFGIYDFLLCNTRRHFSVFDWHKQAVYIPWGTDNSLFKPISIGAVEKNKNTFFHSAGYNPYRKGTDLVIRAFINCNTESHLVIHTQVDLAAFFPEMKEIIFNLEHEKRLEVIEDTVTAPGLYFKGDVYVYPSRLEGIGLTIAEALSCGLPVVVPDHPPMNEFVSDESGRTVKVKKLWSRADGYYWPQCEVDVYNLTETMNFYIKNFSDITVMKNNARNYAEKHLNWSKNSKDLVGLIDNFQIIPVNQKEILIKQATYHDKSRIVRQHWKDQLIEQYSLLKKIKDIMHPKKNKS